MNLNASDIRHLTEEDFVSTFTVETQFKSVPIISTDSNGNDQEEFTFPYTAVSYGDVSAQADPNFNSKFNPDCTGGVVEVFQEDARKFVLCGHPDRMIGEYLWLDSDHAEGEKGANILAISNRVED